MSEWEENSCGAGATAGRQVHCQGIAESRLLSAGSSRSAFDHLIPGIVSPTSRWLKASHIVRHLKRRGGASFL